LLAPVTDAAVQGCKTPNSFLAATEAVCDRKRSVDPKTPVAVTIQLSIFAAEYISNWINGLESKRYTTMALLHKFSNGVIPCEEVYPDKHTFIEALLQKYNVPTTYYQKQ
jgi:hypothetical protein